MTARVDVSELLKFQERLQKMTTGAERDAFYEECTKDIAARFLKKVIKKTPTGKGRYEVVRDNVGNIVKFKRGKKKGKAKLKKFTSGGALKRGWQALQGKNTRVRKVGNTYHAHLVNHEEYASYVEYGHRQNPGQFVPVLEKRLKAAWAPGKFYMTKSAKEVEDIAPTLLKQKIEAYIRGVLHGQ